MDHVYFTIDMFPFKQILLNELDDDSSKHLKSKNARQFHSWVTAGGSWRGYTSGQMAEWLKSGYLPAEVMKGLREIAPPVENRTTIVFNDDDGEFHLDLACSGEDDFFSMPVYEKRALGCRIEAGIMFSGMTDQSVVRDYMVWIAKVLWSLESTGINCSLLLDFPSRNLMTGATGKRFASGTVFHNLVRVKRESEHSDFKSWSAMVSPAALRNFGFGLGCLHADDLGKQVSMSFGNGMPERHAWKCVYDSERRVISIENRYTAYDFPRADMDRQLAEAIEQMKQSQ